MAAFDLYIGDIALSVNVYSLLAINSVQFVVTTQLSIAGIPGRVKGWILTYREPLTFMSLASRFSGRLGGIWRSSL